MFNQSCSKDALDNLPMIYLRKWLAYLLVETEEVFWIVSLEFIKIMLISNFLNWIDSTVLDGSTMFKCLDPWATVLNQL